MSMMSRPAALAALVLVLAACSSSGASSVPPAASGAPSSPPSGSPEREPGHRRRHRAQDRADRRDPALRRGWRVRDPGLDRGPGTGLHPLRRRHDHLPQHDQGRPPGGRVGHAAPPVPDREDERGADPDAARIRARRGRPGRGSGRVPGHDGLRCLDRGLHRQRRRPGQDGLGLRPRARARTGRPISSPARPWRSCATTSSTSTRAARSRPTSTRPSAIARSCSRASPAPPTRRPGRGRTSRPAEFVSNGDPNAFQMPARVMTAAEIEALGIEPFQGGFVGLPLAGPGDGKFYSLSRPPAAPRRREVGRSRRRPVAAQLPNSPASA